MNEKVFEEEQEESQNNKIYSSTSGEKHAVLIREK